MTATRIRSALAPALKSLGFERRGSQFMLRQPELEHAVSVFAARRLTGYFEVVHSVLGVADDSSRATDRAPLVQGQIQGFMEPYLGLWAGDKLDTALAAKQIASIVRTFSSLADVAHFYSDRPVAHGVVSLQPHAAARAPNSLSAAEEARRLQYHSNAVLVRQFCPAPRLGEEMWVHCREVGGYRYCAYLAANDTATFATILYFAFASADIGTGRKKDGVIRALLGAPKRLLADEGRPVLIPLTEEAFVHAPVSDLLDRVLAKAPPNELPRREA